MIGTARLFAGRASAKFCLRSCPSVWRGGGVRPSCRREACKRAEAEARMMRIKEKLDQILLSSPTPDSHNPGAILPPSFCRVITLVTQRWSDRRLNKGA